MLKPLILGNKSFPINIIQGPLAGISCSPFRLLTRRYGQPAFSCTEMISCKTIIHQPEYALKRYIHKEAEEGPVCFQLSGNDPIELAEATRRVTAHGADLIDLNCGCPVKKIRSKGAGSSLLTNTEKLYQLIRAMKDNTSVPVSIKIRVQANSGEKFNEQLVNVVNEAKPDFLIVHGRHWTQHYETPCNHDEIKFFVENVKIPVIGNGDIACIDSLNKMLATGCAGVMIARAGVGQPWLTQKLIAEATGKYFQQPTLEETQLIFLEHVERLISLLDNEKFAILQARQFAKYYARGLKTRQSFSQAVNACDSLVDLKTICQQHFNC